MKHIKIANFTQLAANVIKPGWDRDRKVWIKHITHVDRSQIGGYMFAGNFLTVFDNLTENTLYDNAVYLVHYQGIRQPTTSGASSSTEYACLAKYTPDGFQIIGKRVEGPDYALKLRDQAERALNDALGFDPKDFIAGLTSLQISALKHHLNSLP